MIIDEAHLFAPEKGKAETTASVIDLATRGRKRGLSLIAATQRLSKLHKDVAAELLNKIIGRTGLDIDVARAADELGMNRKEAILTLRSLKPGEFYCFGPALTASVEKTTIGSVESRHPKVGERQAYSLPEPSASIKKLLPQLEDLPKESEKELKNIDDLKKEVRTLRSKLTLAEKKAGDTGISETEVKRRIKEAVNKATAYALKIEKDKRESKAVKALRQIHKLSSQVVGLEIQLEIPAPEIPAPKPDGTDIKLRKGAIRILKELAAYYPAGYTKSQVATLTRFSVNSGTFGAYLGDLRRAGFIDLRGDLFYCTEEGIDHVGASMPERPTTHEEVMRLWEGALRKGAYRILTVIVESGESGIDKRHISEIVGMVFTSGTFGAYLGDLVRNGLVRKENTRYIANNILFPKGEEG